MTDSSSEHSRACSRTPTPAPAISRMKTILKMRVTCYASAALTALFLLILASFFRPVPIKYCDTDDESRVKCVPCPAEAKCSGGKKTCVAPAREIRGVCVAPGSSEEWALDNSKEVVRALKSHKITTVAGLKDLDAFKSVKVSELTLALEFSGRYRVRNGVVVGTLFGKVLKGGFIIGLVTSATVAVTSFVMIFT